MDIERLRALEKAVELVAKATPGPWRNHESTVLLGMPTAGGFDIRNCPAPAENTAAIVAAVNFIREHGSALIAELGQEVGAVESIWMFRLAGSQEKWAPFFSEQHRLNTMRDPLWEVREFTSPAHTSEARDAEVKAMDVLSLAELVDAAVCLESCEAAWCGDEMELAAPRRRLAKAYSGLRKTLFIAQDALECALRNSKRGSRTNAACSTALEYLRRATKQSDDAAMRQEAE